MPQKPNKKYPHLKNLHTISMLVANKPGVLVRIALVFARRGFNVDSLVVSPSVDPRYSRMTITAQGDIATLDQIVKQTGKLVDVIHASEHTPLDAIEEELALFKIRIKPNLRTSAHALLRKYNTKIIDTTNETLIVEIAGSTEELDEFEKRLKKFRIIEMIRSGKLVMTRGKDTT
ncbi:MAG: acetolactate synthase small subunit [Candidatus Omnitrophota bacterium]